MMEPYRIRYPEGALSVKHMGEREWTFEYPRISWEIMEEFHEALEHWRVGDLAFAEEAYRELLDDYPEFIDVHHHLALVLDVTGRDEEALRIWQAVVAMGLECLPQEFEMGRDGLPWFVLENRPFLRAYHALGLEYLERGEVERALEMFENMLAMNPGDNQGVRALVIDCNLRLGRPREVLAICDQYPGDMMEQVVYGRPLALYQLGRRAEAEQALREAIEFLPLVARELVKRRHTEPEGLNPAYVTQGGADQAYFYWLDQGDNWKNTPGALQFVRDCLAK
jgi:tetratricopeptide (TPR) repeat protein